MLPRHASRPPSSDKHAGGYPHDISEEQVRCARRARRRAPAGRFAHLNRNRFPCLQFDLLKKFLQECPPDQVEEMRFPAEPPYYLGCRVLRARKFDLAEALKLVRLTSTWRREKKVRELAENDPFEILGCSEDELLFYYPKAYFPVPDREGRPVYIERGGSADVETMMTLVKNEMSRMVDYHILGNERDMRGLFTDMSKRAGRPVNTLLSIMDMEGMSMKMISATVPYIVAMVGIDKEHYPETLGRMVFINVPSFFSIGFALIKPFLDERTVRKIDILSGPGEWKPRLVELCGAENLPVEYGGQLVIKGGLYPLSRTKAVTLPTGKVLNVVAEAKAGDSICFRWFCRPSDIRMGISFLPASARVPAPSLDSPLGELPGLVALKPLQDHPGSDKFVEDTHKAPADGIFIASFDNRNGWRERQLFHRWDKMLEVGGRMRPECSVRKAKS